MVYASTTVTNAFGSIMPATSGQFRGMAPLAYLYSVAAVNDAGDAFDCQRPIFAASAGAEQRADFEQQLELQRRQRLRSGGGELRRGGARRAAGENRFAAGIVRVFGGRFRRRATTTATVATRTRFSRRPRPKT